MAKREAYKRKQSTYEMFADGKFNANCPRGYNFLVGCIDKDTGAKRTYVADIEIIN